MVPNGKGSDYETWKTYYTNQGYFGLPSGKTITIVELPL
jgi:hypothetical protein